MPTYLLLYRLLPRLNAVEYCNLIELTAVILMNQFHKINVYHITASTLLNVLK